MLVLSKGILLLSLQYVLLIVTWTILDVYGKSPVRFASTSLHNLFPLHNYNDMGPFVHFLLSRLHMVANQ
jgi:hypothetical protein